MNETIFESFMAGRPSLGKGGAQLDPLKKTIISQLEVVYKKAIADGSYTSALKSIELIIRMLPLLEPAPSSTQTVSDLDVVALKKIIAELEKV